MFISSSPVFPWTVVILRSQFWIDDIDGWCAPGSDWNGLKLGWIHTDTGKVIVMRFRIGITRREFSSSKLCWSATFFSALHALKRLCFLSKSRKGLWSYILLCVIASTKIMVRELRVGLPRNTTWRARDRPPRKHRAKSNSDKRYQTAVERILRIKDVSYSAREARIIGGTSLINSVIREHVLLPSAGE